jgi:hydrogenase/urease accessory protein HupE
MLFMLALPIIIAVAAMHRYLQTYAPTNVLARRVRAQAPRWRTAAVLIVLATALLLAMHALGEAVANGAPGWLNLLVLVLAWDAIKCGVVALATALRTLRSVYTRRSGTGLARLM